MPFIPAPGVCQTELFYVWDTQQCETVLHFKPDALLTPVLMNQLGAYLVSWWNTQMKAEVPTTIQLVQIKMTDLTADIAPVVNYGTGLPIVGTNASPSMPNNIALSITKRTALRGKSYRGRIYHPALTEGMITANTVAPANVAAFILRYNMLLTFTTAGAEWDLVVVSRQNGGVPRAVAEVTQVVSLDSDGRVDSQRRRLPGRGA